MTRTARHFDVLDRLLVSEWYITRWHKRLEEVGDVQAVARQMKEQGVPIQLALKILIHAKKKTNTQVG